MSARTAWYGVALLGILAATALNAFLLRTFDVAGIPFVFAAALLVQLLLIVLLTYSLVVFLRTPLKIAGSVLASAFEGALGNPYVLRFKGRRPRLWDWAAARFSTQRPTGLYLTAGALATAAFLDVALAVAGRGALAGIDQRVLNLVPSIRSQGQNAFFAVFTFSAGWAGVLFFFLTLALLCWLRRQWWLLALVVGAFAAEELASTFIKLLVRRPRPERWLALVNTSSYSFPSGHSLTAIVLGGLLAYLLVRFLRRPLARLGIVLLVLGWVVLVGTSRVYLGAHYPSDILGSFALGLAVLSALITALELNRRYGILGKVKVGPALKRPVLIAPAAALGFAAALGPLLTPLAAVPHQDPVAALPALDAAAVQQLPHYSETLTGARMEPINFVFEGSQEQIEALFRRAGWYEADPSTPSNTLRAFGVALSGEQYLTAPVTPSYLDDQPEAIAFEKPTDANTLVQRHHTRIWRTRFAVDGRPLWAATASFDRGIGFGNGGLPTHHIDPNVDAERDYILKTLDIANPNLVHVVDPELGHNAGGDAFFTDGQAAVIDTANPG